MKLVYLLWFEQERETGEDIELLIGVYASETDARAAIELVKDQPGFREYPEGLQIHERQLGATSWTEGFIEV
jgi:hypothetical protein